MSISGIIPCGLPKQYAELSLISLCKKLNYYIENMDSHCYMDGGRLVYRQSDLLPEWIESGELSLGRDGLAFHFSLSAAIQDSHAAELYDKVSNYLSELFSYTAKPYRKRIFCIGWTKTGTTSLTQALRQLGIFAWHYAPWIAGYGYFADDVSNYRLDLGEAGKFDAISDAPISLLYRELDEAFPGSLFIHTTRAAEKWLPSAIAHIRMGEETGRVDVMQHLEYGPSEAGMIDADRILGRYMKYEADVMAYFSGRQDFISIDVTQENPWKPLCTFLGLNLPGIPFPHLNRRAA